MKDDKNLDVDVAVVGAGLAGLTAATFAARAGSSVILFDVRSAGGRARSDERDRYILNQGAHALYRSGPGAAVLRDLGVRFEGSPPNLAAAAYREATGSLAVLPTSAGSLLRSRVVSIRDKIRLARLLSTLPKLDAASQSLLSAADWIGSLGLTPGGAAVLSALTRVVTYAGDLRQISADAALRQLQLALEGGVLYLNGGWQTLVDGLVTAASEAGVRLMTGERVAAIHVETPGETLKVATQKATMRAASVVIAAGSPDTALALLPSRPEWDLGPAATAACLDLGLRRPPATRVAYGLDAPLYLSTHSPNARLAPADGALVHVMRYGARSSQEDRGELWSIAGRCGIGQDDVIVQRFLHEMTVCHALPKAGRGLLGRPGVNATGTANVLVSGDWVGPTGMLADAALSSAKAAGRAAAQRAKHSRSSFGGMAWT